MEIHARDEMSSQKKKYSGFTEKGIIFMKRMDKTVEDVMDFFGCDREKAVKLILIYCKEQKF